MDQSKAKRYLYPSAQRDCSIQNSYLSPSILVMMPIIPFSCGHFVFPFFGLILSMFVYYLKENPPNLLNPLTHVLTTFVNIGWALLFSY